MQFSCESCKALLQISDEKLRGKRLVVKCKRCGSRIQIADPALRTPSRDEPVMATPRSVSTVSGVPTAPDSDTESTRAIDSTLLERALRQSKEEDGPSQARPQGGDPPSWFALVANKQEGPLSRAELALKTAQGLIGPRTYLWREGMADWVRAKDVPEAASFFSESPEPARQPTPAGSAPVANATPVQSRPAAENMAALGFAAPKATPSKPETVLRDRFEPGEAATPEPAEKPEGNSASDLAQWASTDLEHEAEAEAENGPLVGKPPRQQRTDPRLRAEAMAKAGPTSRTWPWMMAGIVIVLIALVVAAAVMVIGRESGTAQPPQVTEQKPEPPPPPRTAPETPRAPTTGLSAEVVKKKLDENKGALQKCVDDSVKYSPNLKVGRIHIATTIAPTGQVTSAKIDKKAVDDSALGTCLKIATRRIVFPAFTGDAFIVDIPIMVSSD
jgi:predicted Zn finger-like uncharacterized protein